MTPHMALYISPLVVSAAVLVALLAVTWRSRSDPVAPWFAATLVAFLIWTVGYVFEILSTSLGAKLRWADFEFIGIAVLPVAWFEVERLATTDPLTELLTRKAFLELGEREMTRARRQGFPVWLVKLDLDHFALVNDLYGSDAGDEVIRAVAGVCRRILRAFDLVGRFGGEEFVMLLPHLSAEEAAEAAGRLRQAVEALAVFKDDQLMTVTASVGLAGTERTDNEFLNDLLAPADSALRRAREDGGNRVVVGAEEWGAAGPDGRAQRRGGEQGP